MPIIKKYFSNQIKVFVTLLISFLFYSVNLTARQLIVLNPHMGATKQVVYENAEYIISDEIDLCGDTLELPIDCILNFHGGSLKNGTIKYQNTQIEGLPDIDCKCFGSIKNDEIDVRYYGARLDGSDDSEAFRQAILFNKEHSVIYLPYGKDMTIATEVILNKNINLNLNGIIKLKNEGCLTFGSNDSIVELNNYRINRIIGDGSSGNSIAINMKNARFNNYLITGIQYVKYAIAFNLEEQSASLGQNIYTFNQIYDCNKAIYFHGFESFDKAIWAEGNQFIGGFIGKCNVGIEFEKNIKAGCTIYQGCVDCIEVPNSFDIIDNSNTLTYHMPNVYICNFVRRDKCILPQQITMIESQSGITTQGFITSHSGIECTNGKSSTYIGAGNIEITDSKYPFIDFKSDHTKDRDTRLISNERTLIIETGQSTKEMRSSHIIDTLSIIQKK